MVGLEYGKEDIGIPATPATKALVMPEANEVPAKVLVE
jgi:hypothetical protein